MPPRGDGRSRGGRDPKCGNKEHRACKRRDAFRLDADSGREYRLGVDRYERRTAEIVLAASEAALQVSKGERLAVSGLGPHDGMFMVTDVSEPDENGAITLTVDQRMDA